MSTASLSAGARELLVRLLRGRHPTITGIRQVAPPHIDLAAALTELESAGFVKVGEHGLEYVDPVVATQQMVQAALSEHQERIQAVRAALNSAADEHAMRESVPASRGAVPGTSKSPTLQSLVDDIESAGAMLQTVRDSLNSRSQEGR